jgi:hypothetical protein
MKQQSNGRNQLIGEYLWIACCNNMSPGEELDPHVLEVKAIGGRKKVSSHIQVLRNFFSAHRCCKSSTGDPAPPGILFPCGVGSLQVGSVTNNN